MYVFGQVILRMLCWVYIVDGVQVGPTWAPSSEESVKWRGRSDGLPSTIIGHQSPSVPVARVLWSHADTVQSLYQEIILLQKFNDILGKVLKPKKKISLQPQKKKLRPFFFFHFLKIGISTSKFLSWEKKFSCQPQKCKLELFMSNCSKVLIYLSFLLKEAVF